MASPLFTSALKKFAFLLPLTLLSVCLHAQYVSFDPIVSTFAGTGAKGLVNGAGTVAKFGVVSAIKLDSKGNAFVVDASNNCIRKITPAGVVSTFGNTITLKNPYSLAIDKNDNLYVTDLNNRCIRKITPAGVISLYAGVAGAAAYVDGLKGTAKFYGPTNIAIDQNGILYVNDFKLVNTAMQSYIRRVALDGSVSTFVGGPDGYVDGVGKKARFKEPAGMLADTLGNLYVVDGGNHKIRKIHLEDTVVTTIAGGPSHGYRDSTLLTTLFSSPQELAFDKIGNIYVTDYTNQLVRKITGNYVTTLAGVPDTAGYVNGAGTLAKFDYPIGIVSDSVGNLLVCDVTNNVIRKITAQKLIAFKTTAGAPSIVQTMYVSGDNLDNSLLKVLAPQGYEVSITEKGTYSQQLVLTGKRGAVNTTGIFIRLSANNAEGVRNGQVTLSGTVASVEKAANLPVEGVVSGSLGFEHEVRNNSVHVYPNPVTDELLIEANVDWQVTECQVFALDGKLVLDAKLFLSSEARSLDVSRLQSGVYVLKLNNGSRNTYASFAKK